MSALARPRLGSSDDLDPATLLSSRRHHQISANAAPLDSTSLGCHRFAWAILVSILLLFPFSKMSAGQDQITGLADDSEVKLRLRIAWGGGARARWSGNIRLSEGQIVSRSSLGLEPNAPGSKQIEDDQLVILAHSATAFDGVDIELQAPSTASLIVEMTSGQGIGKQYIKEIALSSLIEQRHAEPIDEVDNWISIQRAWGDQVRFEFLRDSLVFSSEETFRFDVIPNQIGLPPNTELELQVRLRRVESREDLWTEKFDVRTDESGELEPLRDVTVQLPGGDAVCAIEIELFTRPFGAPIRRPRSILYRSLELVVIDDNVQWTNDRDWKEHLSFDPANPGWWDRLLRWPQLRLVPGLGKEPLGVKSQTVTDEYGQSWTELEPGGWVAYPLPLKEHLIAHRIEVEYSNANRQKLGISLIEPNEAGHVLPLGPDSGFVVEPVHGVTLDDANRNAQHEMIVWPRTTVPLLVIYNLDDELPARFGEISVATPQTFGFDQRPDEATRTLERPFATRKFATLVDAPLLPESFSAPERYDQVAERTLDDWYAFYLSGMRLAESLQLNGRNMAIVSVLNEGSTIYPSRLLDPTPKYDSGAYFSTGQDVLRKDVLEMMFRMFDREGLTLVPQIEFSSPLPDLERQLLNSRRNGQLTTSIPLVKDTDALGTAEGGLSAPRYNPASPEVQQAMYEVVEEIVQRYSHHKSFGGVSIRIGTNTFTHFPNDRWGYDFDTVRRYLLENGVIELDQDRDDVLKAYYEIVQSRPVEYLKWRATELTNLYSRLATLTTRANPDSRLYLSPANLFRNRNAVRSLYPEIRAPQPDLDRVLLSMGLQPPRLSLQPGLVMLQPYRNSPRESLPSNRIEHHLESSGIGQASFATVGVAGSLIHQPVMPIQLDGFAERSPFGSANTELMLFPQLSRTELQQRKYFARRLAQSDQRAIVTGAMTAAAFHSSGLRTFADEFQHLPDVEFEDVEIQTPNRQTSPIVVRKLQIGERTYFYFVNRTPWPITADLTLSAESQLFASPLTNREIRLNRADGTDDSNLAVMRVSLDGYDLVGAIVETTNVEVTDVQFRYADPNAIRKELDDRLQIFQAEIEAAGSRPLDWTTIANPGYETSDAERGPLGWQFPRSPSVQVMPHETAAHEGNRALHFASDGEQFGWIRSETFSPPRTGRISISVWLKLARDEQPPLRISLEGRHLGEEYYRFAEIGALAPGDEDRQVTSEWKRFGVHFDDIPPEGVADLRIGFDMMGRGDVWIDEVQVHDLWLDERDVLKLLKTRLNLLVAIGRGDYVPCLEYLESYWPSLLLERPSQRRESYEIVADQRAEENNPSFSRSVLERVKGLAPQKIIPFR